jgi:hypothetical protein
MTVPSRDGVIPSHCLKVFLQCLRVVAALCCKGLCEGADSKIAFGGDIVCWIMYGQQIGPKFALSGVEMHRLVSTVREIGSNVLYSPCRDEMEIGMVRLEQVLAAAKPASKSVVRDVTGAMVMKRLMVGQCFHQRRYITSFVPAQ